MNEYLTVRDICLKLDVGEWTIRRAINKGELKTLKVSRNVFPEEVRLGIPSEIMAVHKDEFIRYCGDNFLNAKNRTCS